MCCLDQLGFAKSRFRIRQKQKCVVAAIEQAPLASVPEGCAIIKSVDNLEHRGRGGAVAQRVGELVQVVPACDMTVDDPTGTGPGWVTKKREDVLYGQQSDDSRDVSMRLTQRFEVHVRCLPYMPDPRANDITSSSFPLPSIVTLASSVPGPLRRSYTQVVGEPGGTSIYRNVVFTRMYPKPTNLAATKTVDMLVRTAIEDVETLKGKGPLNIFHKMCGAFFTADGGPLYAIAHDPTKPTLYHLNNPSVRPSLTTCMTVFHLMALGQKLRNQISFQTLFSAVVPQWRNSKSKIEWYLSANDPIALFADGQMMNSASIDVGIRACCEFYQLTGPPSGPFFWRYLICRVRQCPIATLAVFDIIANEYLRMVVEGEAMHNPELLRRAERDLMVLEAIMGSYRYAVMGIQGQVTVLMQSAEVQRFLDEFCHTVESSTGRHIAYDKRHEKCFKEGRSYFGDREVQGSDQRITAVWLQLEAFNRFRMQRDSLSVPEPPQQLHGRTSQGDSDGAPRSMPFNAGPYIATYKYLAASQLWNLNQPIVTSDGRHTRTRPFTEPRALSDQPLSPESYACIEIGLDRLGKFLVSEGVPHSLHVLQTPTLQERSISLVPPVPGAHEIVQQPATDTCTHPSGGTPLSVLLTYSARQLTDLCKAHSLRYSGAKAVAAGRLVDAGVVVPLTVIPNGRAASAGGTGSRPVSKRKLPANHWRRLPMLNDAKNRKKQREWVKLYSTDVERLKGYTDQGKRLIEDHQVRKMVEKLKRTGVSDYCGQDMPSAEDIEKFDVDRLFDTLATARIAEQAIKPPPKQEPLPTLVTLPDGWDRRRLPLFLVNDPDLMDPPDVWPVAASKVVDSSTLYGARFGMSLPVDFCPFGTAHLDIVSDPEWTANTVNSTQGPVNASRASAAADVASGEVVIVSDSETEESECSTPRSDLSQSENDGV